MQLKPLAFPVISSGKQKAIPIIAGLCWLQSSVDYTPIIDEWVHILLEQGSVGIFKPVLAHIYAVLNALEKVRATLVNWEPGNCVPATACPPMSCETDMENSFCKWTGLYQRNNLHLSFTFSGKWPSKTVCICLLIHQVFSMRGIGLAVPWSYYIIVINSN